MTFDFWHSRHDEPLIAVPAIGLELRVTLPGTAAGGAMEVIETVNRPGFGPPLHRHPETEVFRVLAGRYLFEVDGRRFHGPETFEHDRRRDNAANLAGWNVLRFTWRMVVDTPDYVVASIREGLRQGRQDQPAA